MVQRIGIIVASGTGSRMSSEIPKQFLQLLGKPIIIYTIEKFLSVTDCHVILAFSKDGLIFWEEIKNQYLLDYDRISIVVGGDTRFQSVKNALNSVNSPDAVVAIHDGVRPFIDSSIILKSFSEAEIYGSAVVCVNSKDSVRLLNDAGNQLLERSKVKLVQTPQTFKLNVLRKAYNTEFNEAFTDDASVVEYAGLSIHLIEGSYSNIKITTPEDLLVGEIILKNAGS